MRNWLSALGEKPKVTAPTPQRTTVEVLNGASLELMSGQSVALIAPSGAGKSTLLHLAGLLERPDAGEVRIGGAATCWASAAAALSVPSSGPYGTPRAA